MLNLDCPKKKEKKKKRSKFDEKHVRKSLPSSPILHKSDRVSLSLKYVLSALCEAFQFQVTSLIPVPLNLSTEESGIKHCSNSTNCTGW